jgi:hypothetical protein
MENSRNFDGPNQNVPEKLHVRLGERVVDPREFLALVNALHKRMPRVDLTEEFLHAAKIEGRP